MLFDKQVNFLDLFKEVSPCSYYMTLRKLLKSDMLLFNYIELFSLKIFIIIMSLTKLLTEGIDRLNIFN